jgi:hypothetical protein
MSPKEISGFELDKRYNHVSEASVKSQIYKILAAKGGDRESPVAKCEY